VLVAIKAAGKRLHDFHMKDLRDLMVRDSQCEVGDGKDSRAGDVQAAASDEVQGQCESRYEINLKDPLPGMVKSFAYMRGVLAGLQA
jgi:hypothetical protein